MPLAFLIAWTITTTGQRTRSGNWQTNIPSAPRAGRRARIRLLRKKPGDAALSQLLANEISSVPTDEFRLLHGELRRSDHWDTISEDYWRLLDSDAAEREKLRAATMLSHAKDDARWEEIAPDTIRRLIQQVVEDPLGASIYYELLSPVAHQLHDGLVNTFVDRESSKEMRQIAMSCFVDFFADDVETLIDGLLNADPFQVPTMLKHYKANREIVQSNLRLVASQPPSIESAEREQIMSSTRQANAAALLLLDGTDEHIWQLLKNSPMPETRSKLIERIAQIRVPSTKLLDRLRLEKDSGILSALMLIFGTWQDSEIPTEDLDEVVKIAKEHFRHHPHAGVHSAAEWMLRKHDFQDWIYETAAELCDQPVPDGQDWQIIDRLGMTLIEVKSPHGYVFQVSATEVTFEQFVTTLPEDTAGNRVDSHPRSPMNLLGWHDAVEYCRKLTTAEDLPDSQQIYPALSLEDPEQKSCKDWSKRQGFRLPYRWELRQAYAGQSQQNYAFGEDSTLLPMYENTLGVNRRVEECGIRKPTPNGFFGLLGNVSEWCNPPEDFQNNKKRPIYGGKSDSPVADIEHRREKGHETKEQQYHSIGFRVMRVLQSAAEARKQSEKKPREDDVND